MYIHEELQKEILRIALKHDISMIEIFGETNHALWELSVLNDRAIYNLRKKFFKNKTKDDDE